MDIQSIETKLNTTFKKLIHVLRVFVFRVFMFIIAVKFVPVIKFQQSLYNILGIVCTELILSYLWFSPNAFPKL